MAKLKPFFKDIFFQSAWMILLRKSGTVTGEKPHSDFIPQKDGEVKPAPAPVGTAHVFFWCLVVCQWVEQKEKDQVWLH